MTGRAGVAEQAKGPGKTTISIERYFQRWKLNTSSFVWWVLAIEAGWGLIPFVVPLVLRPTYEVLIWLVLGGQSPPESSEVSYAYGAVSVTMFGALFGVTFGFFEWLIWRRHIPRARQWFLATAVGLSVGTPLSGIPLRPLFDNPPFAGVIPYVVLASWVAPGLLVGFLQRLVLKKYFARTWWWILPSALTWPAAVFYLYEGVWRVDPGEGVATAVMGFLFGVISGLTLLFISRKLRFERSGKAVPATPGRFPPGVMTFPQG